MTFGKRIGVGYLIEDGIFAPPVIGLN